MSPEELPQSSKISNISRSIVKFCKNFNILANIYKYYNKEYTYKINNQFYKKIIFLYEKNKPKI